MKLLTPLRIRKFNDIVLIYAQLDYAQHGYTQYRRHIFIFYKKYLILCIIHSDRYNVITNNIIRANEKICNSFINNFRQLKLEILNYILGIINNNLLLEYNFNVIVEPALYNELKRIIDES